MKKLLLLLIFSMFLFVACGDNSNNDINPSSVAQTGSAEQNDNSSITTTFTVSGMTCQRCVAAINAELSALNGVISVSIDLRSGTLVVEHEPEISIDEIKDIVILEGFRIE